jgi:glycosyltransferase involved in cell wall biosynthesis
MISQYFTPEVGATSTRVHSFAAGLASRGHDVTVVCEVPNHPQGIVQPAFRGRPLVRRRMDGFGARYVWVWTKAEKTSLDRLAFYGSFAALATAAGAAAAPFDVVFASSPPLPVGAAAAAVAAIRRRPWVLDVRDLWPDAAVALGELNNAKLLAGAEKLERYLYASATAITTVTQPFVEEIRERAPAGKPITLIPNGTTELWVDGAGLEVAPREVGLPEDRFVWTFAGNIGLAQGLEHAVEAAALLGDRFKLVVLGNGAARPQVQAHAERVAPGLVEFRDQIPPREALRVLRASGALLVSLSPDPILRSFVPSKLFDFCAVGRPVVLAVDGEAQRLAAAERAAVPVAAGDPAALADAVRGLAADPRAAEELAARGRRFGAASLRSAQVVRLEDVLATAAAG